MKMSSLNEDSKLCAESQTEISVETLLPHAVNLPVSDNSVYLPGKDASRYKAALKTLIPFRKTSRIEHEIPLDRTGLFSFITFNWMTSYLCKAWKPKLRQEESLRVSQMDSSDSNGQRLKYYFSEENVQNGQINSSMKKVVWRFIKTRIILATFFFFMGSLVNIFGMVLILKPFLQAFGNHSENEGISHISARYGNGNTTYPIWVLFLIIFACHVVAVCLWSSSYSLTYRTATRVRSAFMAVMYKHLIRVSVLNAFSIQQVVTSIADDSQKLFEAVMCVPLILHTPIICICTFLFIGYYIMVHHPNSACSYDLSKIIIIVLCASVIVVPLLFVLARLKFVLKSQGTLFTAHRLVYLQEMLRNIEIVKMTSWERLFYNNISDLRLKECRYARKSNMFGGIGTLCLCAVPILTAVFLHYIVVEDGKLLVILVLLFIPIKDSLLKFWNGMNSISEASAALERLKVMLLLDVTKLPASRPTNNLIAVSLSNANFVLKTAKTPLRRHNSSNLYCCKRWMKHSYELSLDEEEDGVEMTEKSLLTEVDFSAPRGKLIGICGNPGSGKTLILLAILGHLNIGYGKLCRDGTIAYVSQNPWIWDASLRDNITFNEQFSQVRYYRSINYCSLNEDILLLPGGDQTRVQCTTLSMGQRQRVALARAIYSNRDIFLLDDFLSCVDAKTRSDIFEGAILNHLKNKTVIIITQQIEFLTSCKEIYFLGNGNVLEQGTHEKLMQGELYPQLVKSFMQQPSNSQFTSFGMKSHCSSVSSVRSLCLKEDQEYAESIQLDPSSSNILAAYMKLMRRVKTSMSLSVYVILKTLTVVVLAATPLCIISLNKNDPLHQDFGVPIYCTSTVLIFIMIATVWGNEAFERVVLHTSVYIHNKWLDKICSASVTFFQNVCAFDILNWFSISLHEIDASLPVEVNTMLESALWLFFISVIIIYCSIWLIIPLITTLVLCIIIYRFYKPGLMKLLILERKTSHPLYAFVASTLLGRVTIQAYNKENEFMHMFIRLCDVNAAYKQLVNGAAHWLDFRIRLLSVFMLFCTLAILTTAHIFQFKHFVFFVPFFGKERETLIVEVTVLCAFLFGDIIQPFMQSIASTSSRVGILQLLNCDIEHVKPDEAHVPVDPPSNSWPRTASIYFRNVRVDFWPDSAAPKGMTFFIQAKETIGILGLPDSGKMSIAAALYRLMDLTEGSIQIGGMNISEIPINQLRSNIALVPHNPILFTGTIRMNLDPKGQFTTNEINSCLTTINMWETIDSLPEKMETRTDIIGDKMSVCEKQWIYVARAILQKPKILIVEEPSIPSSNDENTIQEVVKHMLPDCTKLLIANQIKYVMNCDRIIVIKDAQVAEIDTPHRLFMDPKSHFSFMLTNGISTETAL